jgi:LAO/AO transport system kinase
VIVDQIADVEAGNQVALARLITRLENRPLGSKMPEVAFLYGRPESAHVIGVTGPAGSGKSTLVGALARQMASPSVSLGILAVDPSSPISGGALLGDRIRMSGLSADSDVFIRSMATRGMLGGLAPAVFDAVAALAVSGRTHVIIETVGVGQDEVEIASAAQTTIVVSVPGLGDHVQAMKAGLLEVADIHVVNKADLPGADKVSAELLDMLRGQVGDEQGWVPPVVATSLEQGRGIEEVVDAMEQHRSWLTSSGDGERRRRSLVERRLRSAVLEIVTRRFDGVPDPLIHRAIDDILAPGGDLFLVAEQVLAETLMDAEE